MNKEKNNKISEGINGEEDNEIIESEFSDTAKDDEEFVAEDGEGHTASPKDIVKDLREKLKRAIEEKQEYLNGWQRAKADLINARKRDEEDKKNFAKYAKEGIVQDFIPVLESFDMA